MAKKRIMITMEEDLIERLDKACSSQGVTKSAYISMVVAKDLGDSEKVLSEFKKLLEKMSEDAGLQID